MIIQWSAEAWREYTDWQAIDKSKVRKINRLVKEITRGQPIGHAEVLRHGPSGLCSAHIDHGNRLVYKVDGDVLRIVSCKGHYE